MNGETLWLEVLAPSLLHGWYYGFFLQGRELSNSVNALRLQTEELRLSVEQQRKIAEQSEQQLSLDIAAKRSQLQQSISETTPNFIFFRGQRESSEELLSFSFELRNISADAVNVALSATPISTGIDIRIEPNFYEFIGRNESVNFKILTTTEPFVGNNKIMLTINADSISGELRSITRNYTIDSASVRQLVFNIPGNKDKQTLGSIFIEMPKAVDGSPT